ncbi:succinyl-diaminopimelate desuccinylase [Seinonella peptonophila]|uniref:Succinyl-diaminopimelate desuccinylase n=1 Tax=Seinonella peptonophila TaxID=112248 RepID=A0A1M4VR52_9BACL|nr:dipeptidase PepV [Seinonella peptonophila]SHE71408.1 succinyl-diaminopimelate desuccinylase [Seinonella peptonophila]
MQQILVRWYDEALKRKSQFLSELQQFLRIESVYNNSESRAMAPFGLGIAQALEHMLMLGERDGFITKNVDGYAGHIEMGDGEELIGVLGHVDVVSPGNTEWTSPPFAPEIRDGKLYARGAIDDKGPMMAAYFAMKIIKELNLPVHKRVRLIIGTDEEHQWRCVNHYFQHEEMPTMGFTPDADFPIIIGEKGLLSLTFTGQIKEIHSKESTWRLEEFSAGQESNKVPDLAIAKIEGDGDVFIVKELFQSFLLEHQTHGYAEEMDTGLQLVLHGVAHHAFEPNRGLNAALLLSKFLQQLSLDFQGSQYIEMFNQYFTDSFFGEKLGIAVTEEVLGSFTINVGICRYRQDGESSLTMNCRYPMGVNPDGLKERIAERLASYQLKLTNVEHLPLHYVNQEHELVQKLAHVYEEQMQQPAQLLTTGGATYARAIEVGVAFGPLFPGRLETAHQHDEHVEIDDLIRAIALYTQAIYELAK